MGIYNIPRLIEKGEHAGRPAPVRSSRLRGRPLPLGPLWVEEAHGQGVVSQFNYLLEKGALTVDASSHFRAVSEKFPGASATYCMTY